MHDDDYLLISANEVIVVVKIKSDTIASMIETIGSKDNICPWCLFGLSTIFNEGNGLHLFNRSRCGILLSPVEGIILLRHLETKDWIAEEDTNSNDCSKHGECT